MERCATTTDRDFNFLNLETKLLKRNYPQDLISKQFDRAKSKERKGLIFQQRKSKNIKDNKVRLIFTHGAANPPIHSWIREGKKLLSRNEQAKSMGDRIQVCSKQPKNLLSIAGGVKDGPRVGNKPHPNAGCYKCNRCKVACPILNETKTFKSTNTGKVYKIRQKVTCDSDYVIYLGTCRKCQGQYVGKSQTIFKKRHSNHKQEVKKKVGGLGHHYGGDRGCGYENISMTIIEEVEVKTPEFLAERELYWQHQLRAYLENGGNAHCRKKEFR